MKILILCKKFPYPLKEGEPIAISYLCRSLRKTGCSISLLVLNTSKHHFDYKQLPASENYFDEIHSVDINNNITFWGALKSFISCKSYILSRFYSKAYEVKLKEVLKNGNFDVVQLETIYMAHYIAVIKGNSNAVIALRAHNVEHKIWEKVASDSSFVRKWYLNHQNVYLKKFELEKINQCDILVAITGDDLHNFRELGFLKKGIAVPVGFDVEKYLTDFSPGTEQQSIAFIGALDWMPNQFGIVWFIEKVWHKVNEKFPMMDLHIAGKNTPSWMKKKSNQNIIIHGEVPDAKAFINQHPVLIAPLFSGSGIKVKVLEGLALGRAVITTSIGVEGISAKHAQHLFIANTEDEFYDCILQCFSTYTDVLKIRKSGKKFLHEKFDSEYLAAKTIESYKMLTDQKQFKH